MSLNRIRSRGLVWRQLRRPCIQSRVAVAWEINVMTWADTTAQRVMTSNGRAGPRPSWTGAFANCR